MATFFGLMAIQSFARFNLVGPMGIWMDYEFTGSSPGGISLQPGSVRRITSGPGGQ